MYVQTSYCPITSATNTWFVFALPGIPYRIGILSSCITHLTRVSPTLHRQDWLVPKFGPRRPQRFDVIQAKPLSFLLTQEDKRKLAGCRFLWCTMICLTLDLKSWSGSSWGIDSPMVCFASQWLITYKRVSLSFMVDNGWCFSWWWQRWYLAAYVEFLTLKTLLNLKSFKLPSKSKGKLVTDEANV